MKNSYQENFISVRKKIDALIFFDEIDMAGPFMPLKILKEKINAAPQAAREHEDFKYLIGLFVGRWKMEQKKNVTNLSRNILDIIVSDGKINVIDVSYKKILAMPLIELENFVECAPDAMREQPEFGFLVGYLDGQLIIEEFGGVN